MGALSEILLVSFVASDEGRSRGGTIGALLILGFKGVEGNSGTGKAGSLLSTSTFAELSAAFGSGSEIS